MVIIICDGCKKRMTTRWYVGPGDYDACSLACAKRVALLQKEAG
jgi:hypothetical protein